MTKKDIINVYSGISAPDSAVEKCLEMDSKSRIVRFPAKRIIAIAACVALLLVAVAVPVCADRLFNAFDEIEDYSETLPYSEKAVGDYSNVSANSNKLPIGIKTDNIEGMVITAQEAYYDGKTAYISFIGEYEGKYGSAERFSYLCGENEATVTVDGSSVMPSNCEFSLLKTGDTFAGLLGIPYDSNEDSIAVNICMPYLEAYSGDTSLGRIYGDFSFEIAVEKSYDAALAFYGEDKGNELYIHSVTSVPSGLEVVFFVPDSIEHSGAGIVPAVSDENGEGLEMIEGTRELVSSGCLHRFLFEPTESEIIDVALIDKNNVDGCEEEFCVIAEFTDIVLE